MSMPERGTQTSQLRSVIQVLQLGNKSGILTVTHQATVIEEGLITFVHGAITDIRLGNLPRQQALNTILGWSLCRFIFTTVETNTEPQQQSLKITPKPGPLPPTAPAEQFSPSPVRESPTPIIPRESPNFQYPMNTPAPIIPRRVHQDAISVWLLTQAGLSRLHKRLFLLINEERNLQDLARLLNHNPQEVQRLLYDLERIGIIVLQ